MRLTTLGISLALAGVSVVGGYWLLRIGHVGTIGQPTDIGGGFLALTGSGLVLAGLIVTIAALIERRPRRNR